MIDGIATPAVRSARRLSSLTSATSIYTWTSASRLMRSMRLRCASRTDFGKASIEKPSGGATRVPSGIAPCCCGTARARSSRRAVSFGFWRGSGSNGAAKSPGMNGRLEKAESRVLDGTMPAGDRSISGRTRRRANGKTSATRPSNIPVRCETRKPTCPPRLDWPTDDLQKDDPLF